MRVLAFIFLITAIFSSCKKDDNNKNAELISSPTDQTLRFIFPSDKGIIIGGGDRDKGGILLQLDSSLSQIKLLKDTFPATLYSGYFTGERFIFGAGDGSIFYSRNLSYYFLHYLNEKDFVPELHQKPARSILQSNDSSTVYIVGGGEYEYGLIQQSSDTFQSLRPYVFENELRCISIQPNGTLWAAGFGILLKSTDQGQSWNRKPFDHEFLSKIDFYNNEKGVISIFTGDFFYTTNGGVSWSESEVKGKNGYVNDFIYVNEAYLIAVGHHGTYCESFDGGKNWNCIEDFNGYDLYDIMLYENNLLLIVGEKGQLWKLRP